MEETRRLSPILLIFIVHTKLEQLKNTQGNNRANNRVAKHRGEKNNKATQLYSVMKCDVV